MTQGALYARESHCTCVLAHKCKGKKICKKLCKKICTTYGVEANNCNTVGVARSFVRKKICTPCVPYGQVGGTSAKASKFDALRARHGRARQSTRKEQSVWTRRFVRKAHARACKADASMCVQSIHRRFLALSVHEDLYHRKHEISAKVSLTKRINI